MKVEKVCPICQKNYQVDENRFKHGRGLTCSYSCGRQLAAQKLSKPVKKRIKVVCEKCGKTEYLVPYKAKGRRFCSRQCFSKFQETKIKLKCAHCQKEFERSPWHAERDQIHYCSTECQFPRTIIICDWCGKEKPIPPSAIKKHNFCGRECCYKWQRANSKNVSGENSPTWKGGYEPYYGPNWRRQSYETRKRDGFACQRCGITQDELGKKLDVHHIKPLREFNKNFKKANAIGNLISLCPSCHSFLEWHPDQIDQFLPSRSAKISA